MNGGPENMLKNDQLYLKLRDAILSGNYPPSSRMPDERQLAASFQVSRSTLRKALDTLEREHYIRRRPHWGTYVTDHPGPGNLRIIALETLPLNDPLGSVLQILPGIKAGAESCGMTLEILPLAIIRSLPQEIVIRRWKEDSSIAGFITFGGLFTGKEDYLAMLKCTGKPVLMTDCYSNDAQTTGFTALRIDYAAAFSAAFDTLTLHGCRRIAAIAGNRNTILDLPYCQRVHTAVQERRKFLSAPLFYTAGRPSSEEEEQSIAGFLDGIFQSTPRPDAILAYNEWSAVKICTELHRRKLRIPEDVSVMALGGSVCCSYLEPSLACISYRNYECGFRAAQLIAAGDFPAGADLIHDFAVEEGASIKAICEGVLSQNKRSLSDNSDKSDKPDLSDFTTFRGQQVAYASAVPETINFNSQKNKKGVFL